MDAVPTNASGWLWWTFSVVIVSLLVNLASAFLKTPVDNVLSRFSSSWRRLSTKREEEFNKQVERMLINPTEAILAEIQATRSLIFIVLGFICIVLSVEVGLGVNILIWWIIWLAPIDKAIAVAPSPEVQQIGKVVVTVGTLVIPVSLVVLGAVFMSWREELSRLKEYQKRKKQLEEEEYEGEYITLEDHSNRQPQIAYQANKQLPANRRPQAHKEEYTRY